MIEISDKGDGCIIAVRAQPGARRNGIVGEHAGMLKIAVTAPPDKGRANDAIIEVLADALGLKRAQVEIVSGLTSREKRFHCHGITANELSQRLRHLLQA